MRPPLRRAREFACSFEMPTAAVPILLVEDDDDSAEAIAMLLRSQRVANPVERVADGEAALAWLLTNPPPALVVLDLRLPDVSGLQVLQLVRTTSKCWNVPVLVVTASVDEKDRVSAMRLGADAYLPKTELAQKLVSVARTLASVWVTEPLTPAERQA